VTSSKLHDAAVVLATLAAFDPVRARPLVLERAMRGEHSAWWLLDDVALPEDGELLLRLIRSTWDGQYHLTATVGRLNVPGAEEVLLQLMHESMRGLAYLGSRRAVPLLVDRLDWYAPDRAAEALDFIVNRDRYPKPTTEGRLPRSARLGLTPQQGAEVVGKAFSIGISVPAQMKQKYPIWFGGRVRLLEAVSELTSSTDEWVHLWRNGRCEIVPTDEAVAYWKEWWREHEKEFEEKR